MQAQHVRSADSAGGGEGDKSKEGGSGKGPGVSAV
jgi:hypothetical protein